MLIPTDPDFAPEPSKIVDFFDMLTDSWEYELNWNSRYLHPLRVIKRLSNEEVRKAIAASENGCTFPALERIELEKTSDIPSAVEGMTRYSVSSSGLWQPNYPPIKIPKSLWPPTCEKLNGRVTCDLCPEPVLTSNWWTVGDSTGLLQFGDPAGTNQSPGVFTHPISRNNIEVPSAGSARFWVGFDFGVWLLPHLPENFNLLNAPLVRATEDHFGVQMVQAGRALP